MSGVDRVAEGRSPLRGRRGGADERCGTPGRRDCRSGRVGVGRGAQFAGRAGRGDAGFGVLEGGGLRSLPGGKHVARFVSRPAVASGFDGGARGGGAEVARVLFGRGRLGTQVAAGVGPREVVVLRRRRVGLGLVAAAAGVGRPGTYRKSTRKARGNDPAVTSRQQGVGPKAGSAGPLAGSIKRGGTGLPPSLTRGPSAVPDCTIERDDFPGRGSSTFIAKANDLPEGGAPRGRWTLRRACPRTHVYAVVIHHEREQRTSVPDERIRQLPREVTASRTKRCPFSPRPGWTSASSRSRPAKLTCPFTML